MGRWLAEFQEIALETPIPSADNTDISHDTSVMTVHDQCVLEEKTGISDAELIRQSSPAIRTACQDLDITPEQFTAICNQEDLKDITEGRLTTESLKAFAISLDEGIRDRRISFYPTGQLRRHN